MFQNFIVWLFDGLWGWIKYFFEVVWYIFTLPANAMLAALKSAFSTEIGPPPFWEYLEYANLWLDIAGLLSLALSYVGFLSVWVTYRIAKSWIPTVSGS